MVAHRPIGFQLDLGGEYGWPECTPEEASGGGAISRQRPCFNGIWDMGYGVQVSGIYFYGSGERFRTNRLRSPR